MQNVAKKTYVVPVVEGRSTVEKKTLGLPEGIGEALVGLYIEGLV